MKVFWLRLAIFLLLCLVIAGAWWAGKQLGFAEGTAGATEECLTQRIATQTSTETSTRMQLEALVRHAHQASLAINDSIARRRAADEQSTREIRYAISQTSAQRADCLLPADVMQQLDAARERANAAATTSGIAGAVPGAAATGR